MAREGNAMAAVFVEIDPLPAEEDGHIELIEDLDVLVESTKCSCNAGDDNPY
jgi:hypothetical protein